MKRVILLTLLNFFISFVINAQTTVTVAVDGSGDFNCDQTNDQVEINQALSYINDQGGGIVHLKAGTYILDDQIKIYSNTVLEGVDSSTSILKIQDWSSIGQLRAFITNSYFDDYVDVPLNDNITLRNFAFDGNRINNEIDNVVEPGSSWHTAVAFKGVSNITIDAIDVYNNLNDAFQFQFCETTSITNCTTSFIGHDAIYFIYSHYLIAENNTFDLSSDAGVRTDKSNHILIRNNYIFDKDGSGGCGIEIAQRDITEVMDDVIIEKNIIEQTPMSGIALYSNDPSITNGIIIRNNVIYQSGTTTPLNESGGINITNFNNTIIQNNTIYNCVGSGIRFGSEWYYPNSATPRTATITNNIITGNTVYGSDVAYGIEVIDVTDVNSDYNNLWNNKSGSFLNCNSGANDISMAPMYVNAPYNDDSGNNPYFSDVDLHLLSTSPCINSGTTISSVVDDKDAILRPQGAAYDIGAYEYRDTTGVDSENQEVFIMYPNPVKTDLFFLEKFENTNYEIRSINGLIVKQGIIEKNNISVNDLKTGVYIVKLFSLKKDKNLIFRFIKE